MRLVERMLHGSMPAAEGLTVEKPPPMTTPSAPSCRLSSAGALLHPWLQQPQPSSTKALSKERIKQFLTRRKWQVPGGMMRMWGWGRLWCGAQCSFSPLQKTGRALLALNRLTLLSQSLERKASEAQDKEGDGPCSIIPNAPHQPTPLYFVTPNSCSWAVSPTFVPTCPAATTHWAMSSLWHFCSRPASVPQSPRHSHLQGAISDAALEQAHPALQGWDLCVIRS